MNWFSTYMVDDIRIELFIVFMIWVLIWKGLTLWLTARRGQKVWFVVFLLINTAGIGELLYLFATNGFAELKNNKK